MKVRYTTPNQRLTFELEVQNGKAAFAAVAAIQELFEEPKCGSCESKNIRCSVRHIDDYVYYSLVCSDCNAQLNYGQSKDGKGLFVKRRDSDGNEVGQNGWYHWKGKSNQVNDSHNNTGRQRRTDGPYERENPDDVDVQIPF